MALGRARQSKRKKTSSEEAEDSPATRKKSRKGAARELPAEQREFAEPAEPAQLRRSTRLTQDTDADEFRSEYTQQDTQLEAELAGTQLEPVSEPSQRRKRKSTRTKSVRIEIPEPESEIELGSTLPEPPSEAMPSSPRIFSSSFPRSPARSPVQSPVLSSAVDLAPSSPVEPSFPDFMQGMLQTTPKPKQKRGPKAHGHGRELTIYEVAWGQNRHPLTTRKTMDDFMIAAGADFVPWRQHPEMPCDEIMQALLQYGEEFVAKNPDKERTFDLSVLLGMAIMCEDEINEAIGKHGHLMYAQEKQPFARG